MLASTPAGPGGELRLALDIQGVHCAACVWLLERLFDRYPAGLELRINPSLGKVDLAWNPTRGDLREYLAAAEKFGYRFGPSRKVAPERSRALLARMAICTAIALNVMVFTLGYYFGLQADDPLYDTFGKLNLALATIAVLVGGRVFISGAIAGLRRGIAHLDLPIALGMVLAYLGSVWAYCSAGPEAAYFDSLAIFVALMLVGRFVQERLLERNRNTLLASSGAEQIIVKRQREDGELEAVAAPRVKTGDALWIATGDLVPVESVVLHTSAAVTMDWITGESDLLTVEPGDCVPAGSFNAGDQGFTVGAMEDFADSRLGDLLRCGPTDGADARRWRPLWWHRVATWYVTAVLVLGALGFALWIPHGSRAALEVTVAILVVTCPCAIGLATPLAEELTFLALRRRGVFVRRGELMDKALQVRQVLLDKTGTLTRGLLALNPASRLALGALTGEGRAALRAISARSNHPVSQCIAAALAELVDSRETPVDHEPVREVVEVAGAGLSLQRSGSEYRLGSPRYATRGCFEGLPSNDSSGGAGKTLFTRDGEVLAALSFQEDFKADAASEVRRLLRSGYGVWLISGDRPERVREAAEALGVEPAAAIGGLTPEAKAELVKGIDASDTLMIGDGLNDSPSFEAAFCAGTPAIDRPVLPGKADFFFLGDGIAAVRWTLAAAKRLRRVTTANLLVAVAYNAAAVGLCLAGWVTPVVAAILMPISSAGVVAMTGIRLSGRRLGW